MRVSFSELFTIRFKHTAFSTVGSSQQVCSSPKISTTAITTTLSSSLLPKPVDNLPSCSVGKILACISSVNKDYSRCPKSRGSLADLQDLNWWRLTQSSSNAAGNHLRDPVFPSSMINFLQIVGVRSKSSRRALWRTDFLTKGSDTCMLHQWFSCFIFICLVFFHLVHPCSTPFPLFDNISSFIRAMSSALQSRFGFSNSLLSPMSPLPLGLLFVSSNLRKWYARGGKGSWPLALDQKGDRCCYKQNSGGLKQRGRLETPAWYSDPLWAN